MGFYALTAVSVQRLHTYTKLHGLTYQKTFIFISRHVSKRFKYLGSYTSPEFPVLNMRNILREEFIFFNLCPHARYGITVRTLDRKTKNYFLHPHPPTHTHSVTLLLLNITKHNCTKSPPSEPTAMYLSAYLACPLHNH